MLLLDFKLKFVLDVINNSLKTSNTNLMNGNLIEVNAEPYDLHESIVNISKHNKTISNNSELSQNIDKSDNLMKSKLLLNCNNSTK